MRKWHIYEVVTLLATYHINLIICQCIYYINLNKFVCLFIYLFLTFEFLFIMQLRGTRSKLVTS